MISLNNIDEYIEKQQSIQDNKMNKSIQNGVKDLINYIKKEKILLFGKSALEIYNNKKLSIPIYCIIPDSKNNKNIKKIFEKIKNKYNILYKINIFYIINTTFYKLNLIDSLVIYNFDIIKTDYIITKNNYKIVSPLLSIINELFYYSTPIRNNYKWLYSFDNYFNYVSSIKFDENSQIVNKEFIKDDILKHYSIINNILVKAKFFESKYLLVSGIKALNTILKTNYNDNIDIIICESRIENEIDNIKKIFNTNVEKNIDSKIKSDKQEGGSEKLINIKIYKNKIFYYFSTIYKVYYKNIHFITFYCMKEAYSIHTKLNISNLHTTTLILLYKFLLTDNTYYLKLAKLLLFKSKNKDLLINNEFQCFQNTFVKDCLSDILTEKNKIFDKKK